MIEMMGVLAVMTIITIAAFTMVPNLLRNQKKLQVRDEVSLMVQNVRMLMAEYEDFSNIEGSIIFGAIGMSKKNPYGGEYGIAADSSNPRQFVITIGGLPEDECKYFKIMGWKDSVEYERSGGSRSGAVAEPSDCGDKNAGNKIMITFGQ
jgi:type II secretory pathway pseudopilin PulG